MSLRELRDILADGDIPLSRALLKAKVIAAKLKSDQLKEFVDRENRGYDEADKLPEFRFVSCSNVGTFQFGTMTVTEHPVPTSRLHEEVRKFANGHEVRASVRELEHSIQTASEEQMIYFKWPHEYAASVGEVAIGGYGLLCISATKAVSIDSLVGVLANVRDRLLDIVLTLQEQFPESDSEEQLATIPPQQVTTIFQTFVQGDHATVATGANVQQAVSVTRGDLEGLLAYIERLGVPAAERANLKNAIVEDEAAGEKTGIGSRVAKWLGDLSTKAMDKGVEWGVSQALPYAIAALRAYFGG